MAGGGGRWGKVAEGGGRWWKGTEGASASAKAYLDWSTDAIGQNLRSRMLRSSPLFVKKVRECLPAFASLRGIQPSSSTYIWKGPDACTE